ncbi:hypothetical protein BpHYR1_048258 [Brachionus plicatilis]|uniref:Uncharacterized protein n=1 Tax=Brachionus plicatilis TaxID=10195 RepID=A0A3M7QDN0_BRAPC|nr:hypothetical protein BpHYR1_048258 [Brachionus plicatilis]
MAFRQKKRGNIAIARSKLNLKLKRPYKTDKNAIGLVWSLPNTCALLRNNLGSKALKKKVINIKFPRTLESLKL